MSNISEIYCIDSRYLPGKKQLAGPWVRSMCELRNQKNLAVDSIAAMWQLWKHHVDFCSFSICKTESGRTHTLWVCWDCCHKVPQTWQLKQWKCVASQFFMLEFWDQGKDRIGSFQGLRGRLRSMPLSSLMVVCWQCLALPHFHHPHLSLNFTWHSLCVHDCLCIQISFCIRILVLLDEGPL